MIRTQVLLYPKVISSNLKIGLRLRWHALGVIACATTGRTAHKLSLYASARVEIWDDYRPRRSLQATSSAETVKMETGYKLRI